MNYFRLLSTVLVSAVFGLLVACSGGETGTGITATQQTTIGTITGFGSVHVNGVRFATDAATNFQINNAQGDESDLAHGMVVAIVGSVDANGTTGTANEIRYAHNMVGIVFDNTLLQATPGTTLDVMGYTINVGSDTVYESSDNNYPTLNTIPNGAVVEISGYRLISSDSIHAARVELKGSAYTAQETLYIKGVIDIVDEMTNTFTLFGSNLVIDYSAASYADGTLLPNKIVSVELLNSNPSIPPNIADVYLANKIEVFVPDEDDLEDGEEVEIEGVVTSIINTNTGQFTLNGLNVLVGDDVEFKCANTAISAIKVGMKLEVEGVFNAFKVLVADEIQCRQDAQIEITAFVNAIDMGNNSFSVLGQSITVNELTITKDDSSEQPDKEFDLDKLVEGDRVELSIYVDTDSTLLMATNVVKKKSNDADPFDFDISGPITDVGINSVDNSIADSITVAGIVFDVSNEDPKISSDVIDEAVEIKGTYNEAGLGKFNVTSVSF